MKNNICFVAGHSGGHIIPCAILAKQNIEISPKNKVIFFTTNITTDKDILKNYKNILNQEINLPIKNLPKNIFYYPKFIIKFTYSFFKSFFELAKLEPTKIVSTGSLVSIPVCLAGKLLSIPIELYELNVEPGKTVSFLAKLIKPKIFICFSKTKEYLPKQNCILVPYPIRFDSKIKNMSQKEALDNIGFPQNKKTILIIGGSQGSLFINNLIMNFIKKAPDILNQINIIHQTGSIRLAMLAQNDREVDWQGFYKQKNISAITFDFNNEMTNFYLAANLIICRAGAGTLAEILFFGKKCITIPLETKTTSHQLLNSQAIQDERPDLFKVIRQKDIEINETIFFDEVRKILS